MISMTIGRTFLKAFNEKYEHAYDSKGFFKRHFFDLFFSHPHYMLWHTNSPFVQMKKGQKPHLSAIPTICCGTPIHHSYK